MTEPRSPRTQPLTMNAQQLEALLPHRYPFALVDRILDYEPGQWAIGRKCVTRNANASPGTSSFSAGISLDSR